MASSSSLVLACCAPNIDAVPHVARLTARMAVTALIRFISAPLSPVTCRVPLWPRHVRVYHEEPTNRSRKSALRRGKNAGWQMFDWNDLRYFLAIARGGSTGTAAKALGVNQSTVQRRLRALEAALDCSLAERQAGGYRLTTHGQQLLAYAKQVETTICTFNHRPPTLTTPPPALANPT